MSTRLGPASDDQVESNRMAIRDEDFGFNSLSP